MSLGVEQPVAVDHPNRAEYQSAKALNDLSGGCDQTYEQKILEQCVSVNN